MTNSEQSIRTYIAIHAASCEGEQMKSAHSCFVCEKPVYTEATRCPACTEAARAIFARASVLRMREVMAA